jgi:hypothetical protein
MEIGFLIDDVSVKQKIHKGSNAFRITDKIFQLEFKTKQTWDLIDEIFTLWKNISIKN